MQTLVYLLGSLPYMVLEVVVKLENNGVCFTRVCMCATATQWPLSAGQWQTPPTMLHKFVVDASTQMITIRKQCRTHACIYTRKVRHIHNNPHHLWVLFMGTLQIYSVQCMSTYTKVWIMTVRRHKLNPVTVRPAQFEDIFKGYVLPQSPRR